MKNLVVGGGGGGGAIIRRGAFITEIMVSLLGWLLIILGMCM